MSTPSFYAWHRHLRLPTVELAGRPAAPPAEVARLLPVRVLPAAAPVEVLLPAGVVLRLEPGCDLGFVRTLVLALGERSC